MSKIPKSVLIGGVPYRVRLHKRLYGKFDDDGKARGLAGRVKHDEQQIGIMRDCGPESRWIVLWHEVLHAVVTASGQEQPSEEVVDVMARGVYQALKDNPSLRESAQ